METTNFELDLLDFHGDPVDLDLETPGSSALWLLEGTPNHLKIDEDISFRAELTAQLIETTVHISGYIQGTFYYRCGRCLEWRKIDLDESVEFVLISRASWDETYGDEDEIVLEEEDLDVSYYENEVIDLRPLLREAVVLELPSFPVCSEDLADACDTAFERIVGDEVLEENEENSIDLRWSKLKEIELDEDDS